MTQKGLSCERAVKSYGELAVSVCRRIELMEESSRMEMKNEVSGQPRLQVMHQQIRH